MKSFLSVFLLLIFPVIATAETVTIRSGQHAQFTRLVLTIPEGDGWRLGRTDDGYRLIAADPDKTFDTRGVFERIQPNRLTTLTTESNRLDLGVTCNCRVRTFPFNSDRLVIDIIDGPPGPDSRYEARIEEEETNPRENEPSMLPVFSDNIQTPLTDALLSPLFMQEPAAEQGRIDLAEEALLTSVARAASQGVLEANVAAIVETPEPVVTVDDIVPVAPILPLQALDAGLTAQTSFDRDSRDVLDAFANEFSANHCFPDSMIDVAAWNDGRTFASQLADMRGRLTSETDIVDANVTLDLAKAYVHFGFGMEALDLLETQPAFNDRIEVIKVLAHLVDGRIPPGNPLRSQTGCVSDIALWSALAQGSVRQMEQEERDAAIIAARALPEPLRGHLGLKLSGLFMEAGDIFAADAVLGFADIGLTSDLALVKLAAVDIGTERYGAVPAIAELDRMTSDNSRLAPDALLRLLELSAIEGQIVSDEVWSLADALRFENRDTILGRNLTVAMANLLIDRQEAEQALALVDDEIVALEPDQIARIHSAVTMAIVENSDSDHFLDFAMRPLPSEVSPAVENAVGQRLLNMGMSPRAAEILAGPASREDLSERRYLRAEAAFERGDFEAGMRELSGLTDATANALRASAFAEQGDHNAALAASYSSDVSALDPSAAWRAGAWERLSETGDPLLLAASVAVANDTVLADLRTLEERRSALDESENARVLIDEMLSRFMIEPEI